MANIVPKGTTPGCPEWMAGHVSLARDWSRYSERDVRQLVYYLQCLRGHDWQAMIDGQDDWGRFCREVIQHDPEFLAEMEKGVRVLDQQGHRGTVSESQAEAAARLGSDQSALEDRGTNQHSKDKLNRKKDVPINENGTSRKRGTNSKKERAGRLKRDHPTVAERMAAGEFKSVAAAERAARGEDPHPPRRKAPWAERIKRLWAEGTKDERDAFMTWAGETGW